MNTILVQMAEDDWTKQALHLACALARHNGEGVGLLRLIQVRHPSYLGTSFGNTPPTTQEYQRLHEYTATAEDYGVDLTIHSMKCVTTLDAIAQAAEQLETRVVFAHVPQSRIPYWRKFQVWNFTRRLRAQRRQLFTLDQPIGTLEWVPSITVEIAPPLDRTVERG